VQVGLKDFREYLSFPKDVRRRSTIWSKRGIYPRSEVGRAQRGLVKHVARKTCEYNEIMLM
jgi:hypothetical protein